MSRPAGKENKMYKSIRGSGGKSWDGKLTFGEKFKIRVIVPIQYFYARFFNSSGFICNLNLRGKDGGLEVSCKRGRKKKRLWVAGNTFINGSSETPILRVVKQ